MPARFLHRHKRLTFTLVVIVCLTLFLNYGPWSARGTFARIVTEEVTQRVDITYEAVVVGNHQTTSLLMPV